MHYSPFPSLFIEWRRIKPRLIRVLESKRQENLKTKYNYPAMIKKFHSEMPQPLVISYSSSRPFCNYFKLFDVATIVATDHILFKFDLNFNDISGIAELS